jgi:predicted naringenin-chalcone synthase
MKPNTRDEMVWKIGNHGFTLRLSPQIPDHLTDVVPAALAQLIGAQTPDFWAIHPGGRAIVDGLQQILALDDGAVAASRRVLCDYGNMSSATILFVLAAQAQSLAKSGRPATGVAMAFGPGLTVEMAQLSYVPPHVHVPDAAAVHRDVLMPAGAVA